MLVTFGTSAASNAGDAFAQSAAAIAASGHRPLLLVGDDRNRRALAGRDDVWTFAPLPAVLPRCRAVVHAGGHGSTAAALHAGIPQLALPMGFDQIGHAPRIRHLGVGTSPPLRRGSPSRLTRALHEVLEKACAAAASRLAGRLHQEDGPATAADHLEAVLTDAEETRRALPLATTILALAARRSGQLPARATTSLLVAGRVPPVLMVFGGLAAGTAESLGCAALAATSFGGWLVTGSAVRPGTPTPATQPGR